MYLVEFKIFQFKRIITKLFPIILVIFCSRDVQIPLGWCSSQVGRQVGVPHLHPPIPSTSRLTRFQTSESEILRYFFVSSFSGMVSRFFPGGEILKLVVLYEFLNSALSFAIHWSFLEHLPATAMAKTRVHRQHTRHTPHSKLFTDWTIGPHLFGQQFPFLFDQRVGFCWQCHSVTYVWAQKKRCC